MSLSSDLISQFVKVTKDDNSKKKESTVYGTTVKMNDKVYVKIDGSDLLTPVVTTSEVKVGERVTVMIKDHYAMVTGNITTPAASTDTTDGIKNDLSNISGKIANFETIIADKVSAEQLEAQVAIINKALIDKATIGQLEAVEAKIKDLDVESITVKFAEIDKAIINKADIKDLNAANASITTLEANFAKINTLVGGNLTMDNIQSLVLTSSKVTVDNAFIKDAMIDRISASKITSGVVDTNLVNLQSSDGSMSIVGSLQQFRDANGIVRIQIGKDNTGDFTFALYGPDGIGQLINQNGITSSAVGDGIIVDSMVSDDASISGSKLDINSVVSEINNGTSTIKSTKIYLNEKEQTLDVAFNKLQTSVSSIEGIGGTVDSLKEKVESNTTAISLAQGNISSLISNTTIQKENGEIVQLKDDYSNFKMTVDGISSKVSSLETKYGKTLKSTKTQYYLSLSAISLVGGSWSESMPTWTTGKYIWQRLVYVYSDGSEVNGTQVCIQGAKGEDGSPGTPGKDGTSGIGIKSITEYYQVSSSNTTQPTTWVTTPPTMTETNRYLWNYEVITYTDDTTSNTAKRVIGVYGQSGTPGQNGSDGKGISSITNYYLATASATGVTSSTSGWTTTIQSVSTSKRYLWNYETITYTDKSTTSTTPCIIGVYGDKGDAGTPGQNGSDGQSVSSITPQFAKHTSDTTAPTTDVWSDTCPPYERGKYLWIRNKVVYTNPTATSYTTPYYDASWDAKATAEDAQTTVTSKVSEFQQTLDGFTTTVSSTYTTKDETSELEAAINSNIDSAISESKDNILANVDANYTNKNDFTTFTNTMSSKLEQTSSDITASFDAAQNYTKEVDGKLQEFQNTVGTHIRFSIDGIDLGKTNSPFTATLDNTQLAFKQDGETVAYISNNKMYITQAEIKDSLRIGEDNSGFFTWVHSDTGNLSLKWSDK